MTRKVAMAVALNNCEGTKGLIVDAGKSKKFGGRGF
jgi:hypothetical protein